MATNPTTPEAATAAKAAKPKTVAEDMPKRRVFSTPDEAESYLATAAETYADFGDLFDSGKLAFRSFVLDDDGNGQFDREVYGQDGFETAVMVLTNKGTKTTKGQLKALVAAPFPSLALLMSTERGAEWVKSIIHKELNHRAVKQLRVAEDVQTVIDTIPTTVDGYIESSRGEGGMMESFDELYLDSIKTIAEQKNPAGRAFAKRRFTKAEYRKSCESKGYALATYPEIEEAGANGSLFVIGIKLMRLAAIRKNLATDIFDRWLETRDSKVYDEATEDEDVEFDFDGMADSMLAEEASEEKTETPAEETEETQPTA